MAATTAYIVVTLAITLVGFGKEGERMEKSSPVLSTLSARGPPDCVVNHHPGCCRFRRRLPHHVKAPQLVRQGQYGVRWWRICAPLLQLDIMDGCMRNCCSSPSPSLPAPRLKLCCAGCRSSPAASRVYICSSVSFSMSRSSEERNCCFPKACLPCEVRRCLSQPNINSTGHIHLTPPIHTHTHTLQFKPMTSSLTTTRFVVTDAEGMSQDQQARATRQGTQSRTWTTWSPLATTARRCSTAKQLGFIYKHTFYSG